MTRRYGAGCSLSKFICSRSVRLDESNAATVVKGWLGHCMFLSRFALSEKDRAREGLESVTSLPGIPKQLEAEILFDLCTLANQFSLWKMMAVPLERLEDLSIQTGYSLGQAQARYFRAALFINEGKYREAIAQYQKALESASQTGDKNLEAEILNDIGFCYRRLGDDIRGEEHYRKSLKIRESVNDLMGMAESLNNLGLLYVQTKREAEAEKFLHRALEIELRIGDKVGSGYTLVNLGFLMKDRKAKDKAVKFFSRALEIRNEIGDMLGLGYCYLQLAHSAEDAGQAEKLVVLSHGCFSQAGDVNGQLSARMSQAEILLGAGRPEEASKIVQELADRIAAYPEGSVHDRYLKIAEKCRTAVPHN